MPKFAFEESCRNFVHAIRSALNSKSTAPVYVNMDLDVWPCATINLGVESNHKGHKLYEKED